MITVSTPVQLAIIAPATQPMTLVEVESTIGVFRLAQEPFTWSGRHYEGRLAGAVPIGLDVSGAESGLASAKNTTIEIADADHFFGQLRPQVFRGQQLRVTEVFRDVDSFSVREFGFQVTHVEKGVETFRLYAQDRWAEIRRAQIPSNDVLIDATRWPNAPLDVLGKPIPLLYGRAMCPLRMVDQTGSEARWFACVGSAGIGGNSLTIVQNYAGETFVVESARVAYENEFGIPLTVIYQASPVGLNGNVLPHYADLVGPVATNSADVLPDVVLLDLLYNRFAGNALTAQVDSASLLAARSFHMVSSLTFSAALDEQRTLESYLGEWSYDALTYLNLRDRLYLAPQGSRAAVTSVHAGNVARHTITYADLPVGQELSRQVVFYRDRTTAGAVFFQSFNAGSGSEFQRSSPFVGKPSVAARGVQFWAKRARDGIRAYAWEGATNQMALETADFATLTHSLGGASDQLVEIAMIDRALPTYRFRAREISFDVFSLAGGVPTDGPFRRRAQMIFYRGGSFALGSTAGTTLTFTASHQLYAPPLRARAIFSPQWMFAVASLVTANNSEVTLALGTRVFSTPDVRGILQYVDLRT